MIATRKIVLKEVRDVFLFTMLGAAQAWLMCRRCTFSNFIPVWFFAVCVWVVLWKGNHVVTSFISKKISWIEFPVKRLWVGLMGTIIYTISAMIVLMAFFEFVLDYNFGRGYIYTIYGSISVTIVISLMLHSRGFLLHWRQAALDAAKYERESIAARYESLKSQVNPHFLFNSFNALTNLVYEDQDKAVKFIKQLSEVYRYVLDTRDKEMVPLQEELRFLASYNFLQKIRFENKLTIESTLENVRGNVAPLALQMLVENAIKHNVVSEADPLHVKLYKEAEFIVVENNLQPKETVAESSAGVGLENICKRYGFLSDKKVEIIREQNKFTVKLPVLTEKA
jgi:hypothetical protein